MNKFPLKFTTLLLIIAGIAASCKPEIPEMVYPIDISYTEYSLLDTDCQWINLPYDEKVIVINSSEELEQYISCTGGSYLPVNFSKHSLFLASGYATITPQPLYHRNLHA